MIEMEWAITLGIVAQGAAIITAFIKLVSWISANIAIITTRLNALENQVNNDVTGRKVVSEMRQDIAVIKEQISAIRNDIRRHSK